MQGSGFPPLGHLPHWPRAGQPERPGRSFAPAGPGPAETPPPHTPPSRRAAPELERSLQFLQQQHGETLRHLHQEIERLKRRNQGSGGGEGAGRGCPYPYPALTPPLSLQICSTGSSCNRCFSRQMRSRRAARTRLRPKRRMPRRGAPSGRGTPKDSLRSPRRRRRRQPRPGGRAGPAAASLRAPDAAVCDRRMSPMSVLHLPASQSRAGDVKIPSASSNPFLVNVLPSYMRKPPSLEECEVVIRQLWNINHMQMQEVRPLLTGGATDALGRRALREPFSLLFLQLMYLRSCLDDIHKTKRIPEDYMLAGQLGSQENTKLPRVRNAPKKWPTLFSSRILTPLPAAERAVLPALKQTLGNAFAERQKRAQAVQRNRLHRTAM
ncbi:coiled-coil domain-containing protein 74A-like isoform X4 [Thamnophis elegans]|uniref:coiled-coil domain-containing protein 74A-like isoform X4 n=1 Tax=Thamnophis elegans TaxID=35005 RepID=UPI001376EE62|nr:coiled-coil domain-containing protein 74A-like isoform X4 [Thamnophis elegans]